MNGVCETAFKVGDRCESTLQKTFVHGGEIFFTFGELGGTESDEVMGLQAVIDFGGHGRGFSDVKRKKGFSAVRHVVRRMACRLLSSDTICSKDMVSKSRPLSDITIASLHERVTDGLVRAFDDSVCLRVVC